MKTLFLAQIQKPELVSSTLTQILPGQQDPWLLLNTAGDTIAYFYVDPEDLDQVQADISGRHYDEDEAIIRIFEKLADVVGGKIQNEEDTEQDVTPNA